jgi:hypothetical protein
MNSEDRRAQIHIRAKTLVDAGHGQTLIRYWPPGIPGFKSEHQHDANELDQIVAAIRSAEDEHDMPWHPDDAPGLDPTDLPPGWGISRSGRLTTTPLPDEGPEVDDATYQALVKR